MKSLICIWLDGEGLGLFWANIKLIAYVIEDVLFHVIGDESDLSWAQFGWLERTQLVLKCRG